ncbi:putative cysteine desulfurase [Rubripirellula lacrimiformis]|uniref:Putative cysteine desulfurase n=1 Tax=Rubripirellula lacrimiformis TaxID=1930273 RepID=A0A517NGL8_9BACT|nr:aminotransferase class V-fold PLP-dependent enzyme [Rubripirellula lacrimiformis]QDT06274.1 putative cysteine desulfurase [Rubripirellula lacrimiformis]
MLDLADIRDHFPALNRKIAGRPVIYLDSAATYLKPQAVIDAVCACYEQTAGTVGRAVHVMADDAADRYAEGRQTIADFIHAEPDQIVFVRNATEAINLVASSLPAGTVVVGSEGEHHSNLLPWRHRHDFHALPTLDDGSIELDAASRLINAGRPELFAFSTIGNSFGNRQPVGELTQIARQAGCDVLLDVNQSIAHEPINVRDLDCDYACFSGHKLGGPTGLGVLYAKRARLRALQPTLYGGGMVDSVDRAGCVLAETPMRLEAGTACFEAVIGLAAACEFISDIGFDAIEQGERRLTARLLDGLRSIPQVKVRGPELAADRGAIVAFQVDGLEAHGVARMLSNRENVCVRSGFHCAQPAHESHGWRPTVRASLGIYNTAREIETLIDSLHRITLNLT